MRSRDCGRLNLPTVEEVDQPMRRPYWYADDAELYLGDARRVLAEMPERAVDTLVTSPPFWGKRDYGVPGQYGLEGTLDEYVDHLRGVFAEAWRVLTDDGTAWLNLGDGYAGSWGNYVVDGSQRSRQREDARRVARYGTFLPSQARMHAKNLLGLPWRVAFALQADGWLLRNAVVWHKPNAMPESVRDRLSARYEIIFLLVKHSHYYFDPDAVRVVDTVGVGRSLSRHGCYDGNRPHRPGTFRPPADGNTGMAIDGPGNYRSRRHNAATGAPSRRHVVSPPFVPPGTNRGDVWSISTRPFRQPHFAIWPVDVPLRCIAAGCRPEGIVLDCFAGAGTTGLAARRLGRAFVGVELNPAYADLAAVRLTDDRTERQAATPQEPR